MGLRRVLLWYSFQNQMYIYGGISETRQISRLLAVRLNVLGAFYSIIFSVSVQSVTMKFIFVSTIKIEMISRFAENRPTRK